MRPPFLKQPAFPADFFHIPQLVDAVVFLDQRFSQTPGGIVWTPDSASYSFFRRYLEVFDGVRAVARVRDVAEPDPGWRPASGEGVSFVAVPHYLGPWQYLARWSHIRRTVRQAMGNDDAVILRAPSQVAASIETLLRRTGRPYAMEVLGDPYDCYAPGAVHHPLRPLLRRWLSRRLRKQCRSAAAVAYVTAETLQRRYPPPPAAVSAHYSSVELPGAAFVPQPRPLPSGREKPFRLVCVGSQQLPYKGQDVLLDALAQCRRRGLEASVAFAGDGAYRRALEQKASALALGESVQFLGQVSPGGAMRRLLDAGDLFVHPSRAEGLPRALIEAMARGLPCIGSQAGGIPELLPPEDTVPAGEAEALAEKIGEVLNDPLRMAWMSARNLRKAWQYREEALRGKRNRIYRCLREATEAWLRGAKAQGL